MQNVNSREPVKKLCLKAILERDNEKAEGIIWPLNQSETRNFAL